MNKEELNNSETVEETVAQSTEEVVEQTPAVEETVTTEEVPVAPVVEETTVEEVVTEEVAPQNVSNETEGYELVPTKKKGNKGPFVVIALVIAVLAAVVYFAYTNLGNPKKMFINSVNKGYKDVEKYIDDAFRGNINKPMVLSNDLKVNIKMDDSLMDANTKGLIEEINKMKLETEIGYDQKNKQMLMVIGALYDNKSLINAGAYAKDEKMYFELKDLFDKYIEVPMEDYDSYFEQTTVDVDDVKYVLSKTKDAFINNLEEKNFKKSNATIKVEGKKVKATKVTYALSEEKAKKLTKKAFSVLVKDSKYIEALATLSGTDKDEIKESMEETIDELTEEIESGDLDKEDVLSFVVYAKGFMGKTVGYEIVIDDEESEETGIISYYKGKTKDELKVVAQDEELMSASISDTKFVFEVSSDESTVKLEVLKKEKGKKTTYSYTLTIGDVSINGDVVVEMIKENKDGSYEANMSASASLMGMIEVTVSGNSKAEFKDKLSLPNVSNSVDADSLTEADINNIKLKIMQNETLTKFITKISQYTSSTTNSVVSEY